MPRFSMRTTRIGTHILVSTLALAAASVANAQSYDAGDPEVVSGNVTFDRAGTPNTETYTINSNTAVLDFIPNDVGPGGAINFQLAGTLAQYFGGLGITDFTVLNRILAADPSRAIQLNGTIISRLQASPTTPGGSVWFYSPGGIIVGSTAVIDVGNLLLATGDPTGGSGVISNPTQFAINSVPDSNAAINVQAGAQITASNAGSYIALVAPAIVQSGTVSTNGSAAYVAAEQTTLTFNSGLFNIQTTVGSNANNNTPLVHDGTTRFIDDSGQRRAYLVSVAKNDAITMLIEGSGQLGFDMATGVNVDNGVVVLSGGFDVADTAYTNLAGTATAFRHDIQITSPNNNANFLGLVNPFAASEIRINALGQAQTFAGDVSMSAGALASLTTQTGGSIDIAGDLDLSTLVYGTRDADIFGGNVVIDASLGNISIGGNSSLASFTDANFLGGMDPAGTVQGGSIIVIADNGNALNMLGNLDIRVEANGADQLLTGQTSAGNAVGGNVIFASAAGSTLSIGGIANIANIANGGIVQFGNASAGNATGGSVDISATDGNISFGSDLSVSATGTGGQVNASGTTAAGNGTGGQIIFSVGSGDLTVGGSLIADVSGQGGNTQFATSRAGGSGTGGDIIMNLVGGGNINVANNVLLEADGFGSAAVGTGNDGGSGTGGNIQLLAVNGAMDFGGAANFNANGNGGGGWNGGVGNGGLASIFADFGGTITFADQVGMSARGRGGQADGTGNTGGFGQGGTAEVFAHGTINIAGNYNANSGGSGGNGTNGADGGDALGGVGSIIADGGAIRFDGTAATRGTTSGGNILSGNGSGGDAQGGLAEMIARNGGNLQILGVSGFGSDANVATSALGGNGLFGSGASGNATGGLTRVLAASGGTITIAGGLLATASGFAGNYFFDPADQYADLGGVGTGGTVNIFANGGSIIGTSDVAVVANGYGGIGVVNGGTGTGGTINVVAIDGLLDFSAGAETMFLSMSGFGGDAVSETDSAGNILRGGGGGGDGIGGSIFLLAGDNGGGNGLTGILRIGDLQISENAAATFGLSGVGGAGAAGVAGQDGGDGGDAVAGVIRIGTNNGSSQFTAGDLMVGNRAVGGMGGDGENGGDGGSAAGRQTAVGTFNEIGANTGGFMTVGNIDINGSALGGNGGAGLNGTGGIGGNSLVGPSALLTGQASAYLVARPNFFTFGDALLTMDSTGGDGGMGTSGRAAGGTAAGFGAAIIVSAATDGVGFGQAVGNSFVGQAISTGGLGAGDVRAASNRGFSLLSAIGGSITLANATLIDGGLAVHQNGIFSAIESGNGFVLVTGLADIDVAGDFGLLGYAGGDVELENLNVVAGGTILFDDPNAPGSTTPDVITINQDAIAVLGGDFTITEDIIVGGFLDLTAGSINTLGIAAGAGITLRSGGTITTGDLLSIGNIAITGMSDELIGLPASIVTGDITSQAGLINIVTNIGDITLGNLTSSNAITINAGNGSTNANAGGDISIGAVQGSEVSIFGTNNVTTGAINATGSLALNLVGTITSGNIATGAGASLISQNGGINTGDIQAGSDLFINTNGAIRTGNITTGGDARLASGDINTLAGGSSISVGNVVSQGQSDIRGFGQIQTGSISAISLNMFSRTGIATGDLSVSDGLISLGAAPDAGGPNANITTGSVQNANGSIFIRAGQGAVQTNGLMSGDGVEITGGESVTVSGAINAVQSINITTNGLASFGGLVDAPIIAVTSGDINFGTNGGLGGTNTDNLEINARAPGQPIIFGGDGSGGGYNLSAMEASKLRSRTIRFNALQVSGALPADITIRDFTMQGSLAGSSSNLLASELFFNSPGNIRVTGAVRIENAGTEDGLFLDAESGRIEVVTDIGGSIAMVDGAGGLGGNLYLDARNIAVGTAELLGRLADDPRFAGRDDEVNAPDGSNRPEGYISANYIQADGFDTIIIQNSGTETLRGGFSAGSGGFVLDSENDAVGSVDAIINGRVANSSGEFLTGADTLNRIAFETPEDPALFSAGSTVNGCLLNGGGCPIGGPPPVSEVSADTISSNLREIVNEQSDEPAEDEEERAAELAAAATGKKSPIAPNIPVVNTSRLNTSPTVTDPITGGGNPKLSGGELEIDAGSSPESTNDGDS